ncbi:MAG: hypothetical protein ACRDZO_01490 [Egibacteraceae bacterium]
MFRRAAAGIVGRAEICVAAVTAREVTSMATYKFCNGPIFHSRDRGATWTRAEGIPEHGTGHINTITTLDDHVALALSPGRMFASHDQGTSWRTLDNGLPPRRFDPKLHFVNPVIR